MPATASSASARWVLLAGGFAVVATVLYLLARVSELDDRMYDAEYAIEFELPLEDGAADERLDDIERRVDDLESEKQDLEMRVDDLEYR